MAVAKMLAVANKAAAASYVLWGFHVAPDALFD